MRFSYGSNEVIHGITLDIAPGQVTTLVGPSGSGKSTVRSAYRRFSGIQMKDLCLLEDKIFRSLHSISTQTS